MSPRTFPRPGCRGRPRGAPGLAGGAKATGGAGVAAANAAAGAEATGTARERWQRRKIGMG